MIYEIISIKNNSAVIYKDFSDVKRKKEISENSKKNLNGATKKGYTGEVSESAARKIKTQVLCLSEALRFGGYGKKKLTFCTLTLCAKQMHTDTEIRREMLNTFLIYMKRKYNVAHYIQRSELQNNGNIHFHILLDNFVHWANVREIWNKEQERLGYIEEYRNEQNKFHSNGFKAREELLKYWSMKKQEEAYKKGIETNWSNPNSTDIHALRNIKNVAAYICKYMTKNEQTTARKLDGRVWSSSTELEKVENFKIDLAMIDFENTAVNWSAHNYIEDLKNDTRVINKDDEHFSMFYSNVSQYELLKQYSPKLAIDYANHYKELFKKLYK